MTQTPISGEELLALVRDETALLDEVTRLKAENLDMIRTCLLLNAELREVRRLTVPWASSAVHAPAWIWKWLW